MVKRNRCVINVMSIYVKRKSTYYPWKAKIAVETIQQHDFPHDFYSNTSKPLKLFAQVIGY
ncbi:hypothetical protein [Sphingobacterium kyonggiense]